MEWDYGDYEGLTSAEIRETAPGWTVLTDGAPAARHRRRSGARVDRGRDGAALAPRATWRCSHTGTSCACWRPRWIGLGARDGARLALATGTLSVLGWEREAARHPRWNACR